MLERDRVFLKEYFDFGHMNHVVTSLAIYQSAIDPAATAAKVHEIVEGIDSAAAATMAQSLNSAVRIPRIALPRLFAEYVAAMEDLGALGEAVRTRRINNGIFRRYLNNDTKHVRDFFEVVEQLPRTGDPLATLLDLPTLHDLANSLSAKDLAVVAKSYCVLENNLREVAGGYLNKPATFDEAKTPMSLTPNDWMNHSHIILDIWDPASEAAKSRNIGIAEWAYFKIKHRFIVVDDMEAFGQMTSPPQAFYWTVYPLDADAARRLLDKIVAVAKSTAELAGLVRVLDELGVAL